MFQVIEQTRLNQPIDIVFLLLEEEKNLKKMWCQRMIDQRCLGSI